MTKESLQNGLMIVSCVLATSLLGCGGDDGPQRYERSGEVNFNGEPVGKGEILISPDRAKGATGPGSTVTFENGEYQTREGMGTLSGPHIVVVSGYDGKPGSTSATVEPHPWGTPLFMGREYEIDFPAEDSTYDFHVKE